MRATLGGVCAAAVENMSRSVSVCVNAFIRLRVCAHTSHALFIYLYLHWLRAGRWSHCAIAAMQVRYFKCTTSRSDIKVVACE
jgi:hypothetical protein